jgi:hypothetical protein
MDDGHTGDWHHSKYPHSLVHVEVALEDPLLHGIRDLGLSGHFTRGWLHDGNALGSLMTMYAQRWGWTRHGASLGSRAEILREVVAFACKG